MPSVTYNSQSFAIDGRRVWIVGASIHYARTPFEHWGDRLSEVREAGFNTIETACPWLVHEPRKGRFDFEGAADVQTFLRLCAERGLRVVLRGAVRRRRIRRWRSAAVARRHRGPSAREDNEAYLERVFKYLRKLAGEIAAHQVTQGGPLLLVQSEHGWTCSHRQPAERYLSEVTRILRESGVDVPVTTSNELWVEVPGTIETWRGWDHMLSHVRQLRTVQPDAPRIVSELEVAPLLGWGDTPPKPRSPEEVLHHFAEVLAGGGQPIVAPFHGGTSFGFLGGLLPGDPGRAITTEVAAAAPLGEAGERTDTYRAMRRLAQFASQFAPVFADADPDYQPVTVEPVPPASASRSSKTSRDGVCSVVPLRSAQGASSSSSGTAGRARRGCCWTTASACPSISARRGSGGTCWTSTCRAWPGSTTRTSARSRSSSGPSSSCTVRRARRCSSP